MLLTADAHVVQALRMTHALKMKITCSKVRCQAIGIALAAQLDKKKYYTYCLTSDGEQQEGNTWEAVMFAGKRRLHNLISVMDRNYIQIDGDTEEVMALEPLRAKYEAFNWHVLEVDGHNLAAFIGAVNEAQAVYEKPTLIIAHTIPGKGVGFMENDYRWHGMPPNQEQATIALSELQAEHQSLTGGRR